ncbi:glutathione S-transferase [Mycena vulgaris]|nr:glutathione S-transferase [Mycena vulgaris]
MVLTEKQIPFELVVVDMAKKDHKAPEYLAKHPFGQVPMIDAEGFVLYESRAICRYLAPSNQPGREGTLRAGRLYRARELSPTDPEDSGQGPACQRTALAQGKYDLSTKLDVYEVILRKQTFLARDVSLLQLSGQAFDLTEK